MPALSSPERVYFSPECVGHKRLLTDARAAGTGAGTSGLAFIRTPGAQPARPRTKHDSYRNRTEEDRDHARR
jgi:hypothetical protein